MWQLQCPATLPLHGRRMGRAVTFAVLFAALYAAHQDGDHWVRAGRQAAGKGAAGWAGRGSARGDRQRAERGAAAWEDDVTRRVDGRPETAADRRFFNLRESGYDGPIRSDGRIPDPLDARDREDTNALARLQERTGGGWEYGPDAYRSRPARRRSR